ncbi:hypothetical protein HQ489_05420 [Candidatus Woesearchaeota archaeon]|nr:hypothetical protein [Candidatus Woesearchaeota archaeon]
MSYKHIKSEFVKSIIKKTKWKDSLYIDDLMSIEQLALGERFGNMTSYMYWGWPRKYKKEWEAIWMELNPKQYKESQEYKKAEKERERKEREHLKREERLELEKAQVSWKKMGGLR